MSRPQRPLLADLQQTLGSLSGELGQMVELRCRLARLELESDAREAKWLSAAWLAAGTAILTALPLVAVGMADQLDGRLALSRSGWLLAFAALLLAAGAGLGLGAWRRFRRRFTLLRQTREELREDLLWLEEWRGRKEEG